jgi:hypothetical protein
VPRASADSECRQQCAREALPLYQTAVKQVSLSRTDLCTGKVDVHIVYAYARFCWGTCGHCGRLPLTAYCHGGCLPARVEVSS